MKEKKSESKKVQETPEAIARRERRRLRKERGARVAEVADRKQKAGVVKKTGSKGSERDKSPPDTPSAVPEVKKRRRMKTVVTQDNLIETIVSDNPADAKIALCDEHYDRLLEKLKIQGIDHLISTNVDQLKARIQNKKIDPMFHATDALIRLSINTIGSEGVVQHRCPVCALNKFDFIAQIAQYMKQACVRRTQ